MDLKSEDRGNKRVSSKVFDEVRKGLSFIGTMKYWRESLFFGLYAIRKSQSDRDNRNYVREDHYIESIRESLLEGSMEYERESKVREESLVFAQMLLFISGRGQ